jgi:hypothetical protein
MVFFGVLAVQGSLLFEPSQAPQVGEPDRPPEPTDLAELERREVSEYVKYWVWTMAPDETCGYLSGSSQNPVTCENNLPCMWGDSGFICGDINDEARWDIRNACYDQEAATNPKSCDDTCVSNKFRLHCTNESAPYCATYLFSPISNSYFVCTSTSLTRILTASLTFVKQLNRQFDTTTLTSTFTTTISGDTSDTQLPPPITTTSSPSITPTSSLSSSTAPSTSPSPSSGQNNLGPIIGGAVGGFVAISLVALAVFWLVRQPRNTKARQSVHGHPSEHDTGKTEAQTDWRSSTATALSWPNSASLQTGTGLPTSPSALSETSQGMVSPMRQQLTHEMSGESVPRQAHELGDSRIYEMGSGPTAR